MMFFIRLQILVLLMAVSSLAAGFSASVDKNVVPAGRSFTLTLEFSGKTSDEPDLSVLEKSFTILSRQNANESSFINGNHQAKTSWILELLPRSSAKNLTIPAIKLGKYVSQPINVVQSDEASTKDSDDISVVMSVDRPTVYVHGELVVTINIRSGSVLRNATLTKLDVADAIIEPLNEGERSEVVENGIKYNLYKQSYAVYPNNPGSLTIAPVIFRAVSTSSRNGNQGMRGFFSNGGTSVSTRSNSVTVNVKDVPADYPAGQQFLPLKSFVIIESFDEANPSFEVNKATARRYEIKAKGALSSLMPSVAIPSIKELQIYGEAGTKIQKSESDGMISSAKFSHIYMPLVAGRAVVPEQIIYWWDVDEDKVKTATIRALEIDIKGDAIAPPQINAPANNGEQAEINPPQEHAAPSTNNAELLTAQKQDKLWPALAGVFLLLWLVTMAYFLWQKHRLSTVAEKNPARSKEEELADLVKNVIAACKSDDAKKTYGALNSVVAWLAQQRIVDEHTRAMLMHRHDLEQALYQGGGRDTAAILADIKRAAGALTLDKASAASIAPLYPT